MSFSAPRRAARERWFEWVLTVKSDRLARQESQTKILSRVYALSM